MIQFKIRSTEMDEQLMVVAGLMIFAGAIFLYSFTAL